MVEKGEVSAGWPTGGTVTHYCEDEDVRYFVIGIRVLSADLIVRIGLVIETLQIRYRPSKFSFVASNSNLRGAVIAYRDIIIYGKT